MADRVLASHRAAKKREQVVVPGKEIGPGDPGWVSRARVPMVDTREYVKRPEWQTHVDMSRQTKKGISLLEKHKRKFAERRRDLKAIQAIKISIEGKNMDTK